jgi:anthranilate synthase component 1
LTEYAAIDRLDAPADLLRLHSQHPERYPFLLQSSASSGALGRYDVLFAFPGETIAPDAGFLNELDTRFQRERVSPGRQELPFTGGWFIYLGYELAAEIETGLTLGKDRFLPVAFAVRCPAAIVHDREEGASFFVHENYARVDEDLVLADIANAARTGTAESRRVCCAPSVTEADPVEFTDAVARAKAYIADGDIYQANLSREWQARIDPELQSVDLYKSLCDVNPAPFAGIARWGDSAIISSSPERLLRLKGGYASTRPIAGTRPRSGDQGTDADLSAELFAHPKERAEHVMLVDLERNDLGRICEPGSVVVDEMMVLESYAHVHHIVSNVTGKLRKNVSPGEAIAAVFPGGTITGCPKVRCMEIISELEQGPRGAYTGSFGYLNRDGSMDLNILIRTIVMRTGYVTLRAGSGIVADSEADAELEETRAKAKGMIKAMPQ